jgi:hypothetical protein
VETSLTLALSAAHVVVVLHLFLKNSKKAGKTLKERTWQAALWFMM